jgi:tRNA A-37 threonylcarbamoyl transferase component Bud32/tetratricopeptide (TPR) repeat protein
MAEKKKRSRTEAMRRAIEHSATEKRFTTAAVRKKLDQTATDDSTGPAKPEQYLDQSGADSSGLHHTKTATDITDFRVGSEVAPETLGVAADFEKRFDLQDRLGKGATGLVYAVRDNSLDRTVAVKFLQRSRSDKAGVKGHFIHEARVTATLEHPNIMPVYDIGATAKGQLFFAMKKIAGGSLGAAIRDAHEGRQPPSEFRTMDGRVRIFLKVADALAYAHHRGYIHQDVKPENIMLGEFGEVLLVDWGSALRKREDGSTEGLGIYGTPAYMSPEQARREAVDERSDVYCLGATLFHALLLRHPTWADDPEIFWEKKRRGAIDAPTDAERRRVPAALLAIALKALAADPVGRYQSMAALADDLKRYQAGLAVGAHRESPLAKFRRWYRHNGRLFWISSSLTLVVVAVATLLLREKIQELATWRYYYSDNFSYRGTAELSANWNAYLSRDWYNIQPEAFSDTGGWRVKEGRLQGCAISGFNNISFGRRIPGDIRVEWDAVALLQNLNLNCFIGGRTRREGYMFHVAAFGDPRRCAVTKGVSDLHLEDVLLPRGIATGRTYHFRMEKLGQHVRLFVDGRTVLDFTDIDAQSGEGRQTFGFENNSGNRIAISNVVVYYHPLPRRVSPLVAADQFFERGYYADALRQYRDLATVYRGQDIAAVAGFRAARCLARLDSSADALAAFEAFSRDHPSHELAAFAYRERAHILESSGDTAAAESCYVALGRRFPGHAILRSVLMRMSADRDARLRQRLDTWRIDTADDGATALWVEREVRRILDLGTAFGVPLARNAFLENAATELRNHYAWSVADIFQHLPHERFAQAQALGWLGAWEREISEYSADQDRDMSTEMALALYSMGRYEDILKRHPEQRRQAALSLLRLGHAEQVLKHFSDQQSVCVEASAALGRFDDAVNRDPNQRDLLFPLMADLGWLPKYRARGDLDYLTVARTLNVAAGKPDSCLRILANYHGPREIWHHITYQQALVAAGKAERFVLEFDTAAALVDLVADAQMLLGRFDETMATWPRHEAVMARCLRQRGEFDAVLSRYPYRTLDCIETMWLQGRQDEFLTMYPRRDSLCATALLSLGRFRDVLRDRAAVRNLCAEALLQLGRYDEVLSRYPDQRVVCARALIARGLIDSALSRFPESRRYCAAALLDQKRYQDVVARFPDQAWEYALALSSLRRYNEIPRRESDAARLVLPRQRGDLLCLQALQAQMDGKGGQADSLLGQPRLWYFAWWEQRFGQFLLRPVLAALRGDGKSLAALCDSIVSGHPYMLGQQLWYEAAFLGGKLSERQFLDQPCRFDANRRLLFVKALRDDVRGQAATALESYRACAAAPSWPLPDPPLGLVDPFATATVKQFIAWRIEALDRKQE